MAQHTKTELFGLVLFAVIGATALVLGVVQAHRTINDPFKPDPATVAAFQARLDAEQVDKSKDTDGDGLTDYDELHVYRTSPYIKDSDSDGIDDKSEILHGTNPNCPEGKTCAALPQESARLDLGAFIDQGASSSDLLGDSSTSIPFGLTDPKQVREAFVGAGINKDSLDALSDDEVMQIYQESFSGANAPTANAPVQIPTNITDPTQIRALLGTLGIPKDSLDKLSDEEVLQLYKETVAQEQKNAAAPATGGN
jgi:hypothetical protein